MNQKLRSLRTNGNLMCSTLDFYLITVQRDARQSSQDNQKKNRETEKKGNAKQEGRERRKCKKKESE